MGGTRVGCEGALVAVGGWGVGVGVGDSALAVGSASVGGTDVAVAGIGVLVGGTSGVRVAVGVSVIKGNGVGLAVAVYVGRRVDVGVGVGVSGPFTIRRPTEHPNIPNMTRPVITGPQREVSKRRTKDIKTPFILNCSLSRTTHNEGFQVATGKELSRR